MDDDNCVTIIHFNDCYNIEPGPQSSGAAGFLTAINQHRYLNPMILFSGDIISPSFISTFTKGEQMIPVLNDIRVDCAVFGNHEFDYGVDNLIEFVKRTTFPWLLSNVIDKETSNQLGDGQVFHIIERSGFKFGLVGLIEEEWLSTLSTLDSSDVIYEDFVTRGRELARWLKSGPHQVDYVIALTHFRTPNDIRLADSVPEIDLILGGHDHDYEVIKRPNCHIIKSGTDFREFSKIKLKINEHYKRDSSPASARPFVELSVEHVRCLSYEPDEQLKSKLDKFVSTIDEKMGKVLGQFGCELDGRFASIRKFETNLGNFVTDIMLASTHADLAILNSGTLRSDRIHPKGDFTMRDLFNILGYIDPIAVLQATGHQIWRALENGVSQWPKLEGRFPQISGCSFIFDPNQQPLKRIDPKNITIGDEPLVLDKQYKLTTKAYLASGKDGYDVLKECQILVPGDESPDLTTSILNHFEAINIVKSNRRTHHRQSIICLSRTSLKKILNQSSSLDISNYSAHTNTRENSTNCTPSINNVTAQAGNHHPRLAKITGAGSLDSTSSLMTVKSFDIVEQEENELEENNEDIADSNNNNDGSNQARSEASDTFGDELVSIAANNGHTVGFNHLKPSAASTPLAGTVAPTPSLRNMAQTNRLDTPPSTIPRQPREKRLMSLYEMEHEQCKMEPKIEGRIRIVGVDT